MWVGDSKQQPLDISLFHHHWHPEVITEDTSWLYMSCSGGVILEQETPEGPHSVLPPLHTMMSMSGVHSCAAKPGTRSGEGHPFPHRGRKPSLQRQARLPWSRLGQCDPRLGLCPEPGRALS